MGNSVGDRSLETLKMVLEGLLFLISQKNVEKLTDNCKLLTDFNYFSFGSGFEAIDHLYLEYSDKLTVLFISLSFLEILGDEPMSDDLIFF